MLMQRYDPAVDSVACKLTFQMAGGHDGILTKNQFYNWVQLIFENISEDEFDGVCSSLLVSSGLQAAMSSVEKDRRAAMKSRESRDKKKNERAKERRFQEQVLIRQHEEALAKKNRKMCKMCGGVATLLCRGTEELGCGGVSYCVPCSQVVHGMIVFSLHEPVLLVDPEIQLAMDLQATLIDSRVSFDLLNQVAKKLSTYGSHPDLVQLAKESQTSLPTPRKRTLTSRKLTRLPRSVRDDSGCYICTKQDFPDFKVTLVTKSINRIDRICVSPP